jgi:hydrogenase maturation protease
LEDFPVRDKNRILVLGSGNPFLGDDSAGWRIVEELQHRFCPEGITLLKTSHENLDLLELLTGYDRVIIVDATLTKAGQAGQISRLLPQQFCQCISGSTPHTLSLAAALETGKKLGLALPEQVVIYAIEVRQTDTFSEQLSPEVAAAVPVCAEMIAHELVLNEATPHAAC